MKLLLDQNLSYKLLQNLLEDFPSSTHVRNLKMEKASDTEVWNYAKTNNFIIVSKDADFHQRSFLEGYPPKVIGILTGNSTTNDIEKLLLSNREQIYTFENDSEASFLELRN